MSNSGRKMTIRQIIVAFLSFLLLTGVGGGVLAATALPAVVTAGTLANAGTRVFDDLPTDIDFTKPSEQSVILAADGSLLATFFAENRIVVASDQISPLLKQAAVAIEDERFYTHNGIDAQGLLGAAFNNFTGGRLAGGSTITQQYVKNALIEKGRILGDSSVIASATERSIARKLSEARYAIAVENKLTKDEILTGYLNLAQFGPSQWGVEAASRYFFGVSAKDVSLPQAAMIAGITQAPGKWNPITKPGRGQASS
ncbi:transglycosylase domain-containing protein [Trueperella pyogenes]|uniref:transglycosylase domain-containing protein n=1 Tax=Trueperella pyogenes TaxID=1661 RepID=UPI003DA8DAF5